MNNTTLKTTSTLLATLIAACSGSDNDTAVDYSQSGLPAYGDILVDTSLGEASNLVWFLSSDMPSHTLSSMMYDALLDYDGDLNLKPKLAESWEVSPNGLSITFKINQKAKWQDGTPITAHDALATFEAITAPATITPYAEDYTKVTKAEVVDDHTFRINYSEPFAPALSSWAAFQVLPKHILDQTSTVNETSLRTTPLASGPYQLESWIRDKENVVSMRKDYYGRHPYINKIRTRVITDQDTQFLELKAQRLDSMDLKPLQAVRLSKDESFTKTFNVYNYLDSKYIYLGFNLKNPMFAQKAVRQALSFATPRDQIVQAVLMNQGVPATGPFKPGTWAHNDSITPYPFDLNKAAEMLDRAGWVDTNNNGIRDKEIDGQRKEFSFTVVTNQGNDQRIKSAEMMQQTFKQIGVEMNIQVQEWATFVEQTIKSRNFEAFILGWNTPAEPDPFDIWHSSKQRIGEFNVIGFENDTADALIEASRNTFDIAARQRALYAFQKILHEEQPYLFLYVPFANEAVHKRFKGIEPKPAGIGYNYTEWYVPADQQMYKKEAMIP